MRILYLAFLFVILISGLSYAQSTGKIGYIDLQRVILESKAGKTAKGAFEREFNQKAALIEQKKTALDQEKESFLKQSTVMDEEARLRKADELQKREKDLNRTRDDYRDELQRRDLDLSKQILSQVVEIINNIGQSEGYEIIIEKSEGGVLCCKGADITDRVIKAFDAKHQ
jgi:outer membrane protein